MSFSEPCALAVDFGGTSIKMGVTAGDRILATADRIPTTMFESPQAIIDAMVATALGLREQFPTACVMGMGMPGWCDYYKGVLYQLTNVKVWDHEIPVKEMMERAVGLPVVLDNDANCMAYAEWKLGAGRGMSSLVCLTMGTGIGGGIVLHDRILRGRRISAAEFGQTSIHYQGKTGPSATAAPLRNTSATMNWRRRPSDGMRERALTKRWTNALRGTWTSPPAPGAPWPCNCGRIPRKYWPA